MTTSSPVSFDLIYGKVPPQAKDMEEAILGAIMLEKDAIDQAALILTPECFYLDNHQRVYRAMLNLHQKGQPIDVLTVTEALSVSEEIEIVGGPYAVSKLTNTVVSSANLAYHANVVFKKFVQREMIRIGGEIVKDGYSETEDVFNLLDQAEKRVMAIGQSYYREDIHSINDVLIKAMQRIQEWRVQDSSITGIPSGFPSLDRATRGWQNGNLIVIAARPSVGKTALALNLIDNAANNTHKPVPVACWSLEMDSVELVLRLMASRSEIILHRIQTGKLDDEQMHHLYRSAVQTLAKDNIFFDDAAGLTLFSLRAKARRLKKKRNIGLIVIDYMQLMDGSAESGNREQEISRISRGLKLLAKELQIPIIALSQLSREVEKREKKKPQLSDLRESGAIEQDADLVMFLWGPSEGEIESDASLMNRRYAKIAKQRNGMLITVDLDFKNEIQLFKEHKEERNAHPELGGGNWRPIEED